ncbi:hypothetical protein [Lysinibacillus xylanilyticus]|nr:hypothetical protein [Lysinibacillus xylanilyticus]
MTDIVSAAKLALRFRTKTSVGLSTKPILDALNICAIKATLANVFCSESKATAANVFCAKAKRQQQMFSARKQSGSGNYAEA